MRLKKRGGELISFSFLFELFRFIVSQGSDDRDQCGEIYYENLKSVLERKKYRKSDQMEEIRCNERQQLVSLISKTSY